MKIKKLLTMMKMNKYFVKNIIYQYNNYVINQITKFTNILNTYLNYNLMNFPIMII